MCKTKVCTKCGEELPATSFNKSKKGCKLGLRSICRSCQSKEGKDYYEKNKPPLKRDEILGDTKICIDCGIEYPRTTVYFYEREAGRDGLRNDCKLCNRKSSNMYRENNKEQALKSCREYHRLNRDVLIKKAKKRYQDNKIEILNKKRENYEKNKDKIMKIQKKCYQNNKERVKGKSREYYYANRDIILEKDKIYKEKHKDRYRIYKREHKKEKYANDIQFNLNEKISSGIRISLRNGKDGRSWERLVDFNISQLIKHLESLFRPGMTWDKVLNGEIHIDHKRPKASFNFESPDDQEFKQCWSLDNLQPLWAKDNLRKHSVWNGIRYHNMNKN